MIGMKIRFLRTLAVEVESSTETWDKTYFRWDEVRVEEIYPFGRVSNIKTHDGNYLIAVPSDAFEKVLDQEKKKLDIL